MVRAESRSGLFHLPVHCGRSGAASAREVLCGSEGEPSGVSFVPGDRAEFAIPGWDNLWIDLGGEG